MARAGRAARRSRLTTATRATRDARRVAAALRTAAESHPGDEASFRAKAERALEEAAERHGVTLDTRRELTLATGIADAVFNRLIIEWEPPGGLAAHRRHGGNQHAVNQLQSYVNGLAAHERRQLERLAAVACDGRFSCRPTPAFTRPGRRVKRAGPGWVQHAV